MNQNPQIEVPGYRIERILGKGGMATVYLATQMSLGRPVALKVLHDPETPQFFERFLNEGRCIARLNHSNLIAIHDIGQGDGFYYIAMEYLAGGDLKSRIAHGIKRNQALTILEKLAGCLAYVHNEGVIHRDIKPSNILFRNDGTPVLTDFGIAKLMQSDNDLTVTGTVMGSPHYLSPELAQGNRRVDGRSDLYALGIILFEMLTGRKPYTADSFAATLMAHIQKPVPELPPEHADLQPVLERLLAKKPEDRFQNGGELIKQLQIFRSRKQATQTNATGKPEPRQNKSGSSDSSRGDGAGQYRWSLLAAAVVLVTVVGWLLSMPPRETNSTTVVSPADDGDAASSSVPIQLPEAETRVDAPAQTASKEATPEIADNMAPGSLEPEAQRKTDNPVTPNPESPQKVLIGELLNKAARQLAADRLSYPVNDNARHYYNQVLAQDPNNLDARQGLDRVAERYAALAQRQLNRGRLLKARRYASQGLEIRPRNRQLLQIIDQLDHPPEKTEKDIFDQLIPEDNP